MDELLAKLLDETQDFYNAARNGDLEKIGESLEKRGHTIEVLRSKGKITNRTPEQKAVIKEIIDLDAKATVKLKELAENRGKAASNFNRKASGLLKYNNSLYNFASGQLVDKRD
ncbi:MAG TPA: hypothetical protein VHO66_07590 [Ruminiclostridium sp.]|nr:hypothetical protein [Ruminiclostridium sp.]